MKQHLCVEHVAIAHPRPVLHFVGPPGCGKGMVASYLCEHMNCVSYSVGQLMRDELASGSELSKELECINKGQITKPEVAMRVISKYLNNHEKNVILDGFPRSVEQAQAYIKQIGQPDFVVFINVSEQTALKRLCERSKESARIDDDKKVQEDRINIYYKETYPVIEFLRDQQCRIFEFNGEEDKETVCKNVLACLTKEIE